MVFVNLMLRKMLLMMCVDMVVGGDIGGKVVVGILGGERRWLVIASETFGLGTTDSKSGGGLVVFVDELMFGFDVF